MTAETAAALFAEPRVTREDLPGAQLHADPASHASWGRLGRFGLGEIRFRGCGRVSHLFWQSGVVSR